MEYINPNNPVYISYSWEDERNTEIEEPVNALCELMDKEGILYKRDKANGANALAPYRRNIEKAEEEIGNGEFVILALSIKYFKSPHCLYELHCILQNDGWEKRVYPVITDTLLKNSFVAIKRYLNEDLFEELSYKNIQGKKTLNFAENHFLSLIESYILDIDKINEFLVNYVTIFEKGNYDKIIKALKTAVQNGVAKLPPDPNVEMVAEPTPSNPPDFYFPIEKDLVPREKDVRKMLAKIKKNDFVNLYGIGGCGKTSLVNLFVRKYREIFDQIAYVIVDNNVKDDFVEQINKTLNYRFENGTNDGYNYNPLDIGSSQEHDRYSQIVGQLEKEFPANDNKKYLFIIDINTDNQDARDFARKLLNPSFREGKVAVNGWKYLLLSRVSLSDKFAKYDMNNGEKDNGEFLKKLFLKMAGERYESVLEEKWDSLFKKISYSPLLTEILGIYLKENYADTAPRTFEQIEGLLGNEDFVNQDLCGVSACSREEKKLINYLRNLVEYSRFTDSQQKLVRHFLVWPSRYIPQNVVFDLLKGIYEKEEALESDFLGLVRLGVFSRRIGEDGRFRYELHRLMADSIKAQLKDDIFDWTVYVGNVNRILDFGDDDFAPYIDLIGYSLSLYDLNAERRLLAKAARKSQLGRQYTNVIYDKVISLYQSDDENMRLDNNNKEKRNFAMVRKNYAVSLFTSTNEKKVLKKADGLLVEAINVLDKISIQNPKYLIDLFDCCITILNLRFLFMGSFTEDFTEGYCELACETANEMMERNNQAGEFVDQANSYYFNYYLALANKSDKRSLTIANGYLKKGLVYLEKISKSSKYYCFLSFYRIGGFYESIGEYESAMEYYKKAVEIVTENDKREKWNKVAHAYDVIAKTELAKKDCKNAIDDFRKEIEILENAENDGNNCPQLIEVYLNYGEAQLRDYRFEKRKRIGEGTELEKMQQLDEVRRASHSYESALERVPETNRVLSPKILGGYANTLFELGYYSDAITYFNMAIGQLKKKPNTHDDNVKLVWMYHDIAYCYSKPLVNNIAQYEQAFQALKSAYEIINQTIFSARRSNSPSLQYYKLVKLRVEFAIQELKFEKGLKEDFDLLMSIKSENLGILAVYPSNITSSNLKDDIETFIQRINERKDKLGT